MQAKKLQVKIFAQPGSVVAPEAFIPIFHRWIKDHVLSDLMIDVANYAHVPRGPGVVLIGHAFDTFVDESDGRLGILHNRKRDASGPSDRLADAFRLALHVASLLEREPSLEGKLRFFTGTFLFRINDRLVAPSTDETFAAMRPELETLAARLCAGPFQLRRVGDAKSLFGVTITSPVNTDLVTLLERLGGPPVRLGASPV